MYLNINEKGIMLINLCSIHRKPGLRNLIKVSDIKEVTNQELIRTEIVYQRSQGH